MKKKSKLSCWDWRHPFRSIRNCWWRVTKGFCPSDTWDWYTYQANLIHDSLMYLAAHHFGTPYEYIDKPDGWTDKLEQAARKILDASCWEDIYDNPFRDKYFNQLDKAKDTGTEGTKIDSSKVDILLEWHYRNIEQKNEEKAKKELKEAFDWLYDNWFDLWD